MGTGGALAAVIFYFHQKTTERHSADLKAIIEGQHFREDALLEVVKENTASNTKLITVIDTLHRRLTPRGANGEV